MSKTLCDLKPLVKNDLKAYLRFVDCPTHICKKCGRVANRKSLVCRPAKISDELLK